MITNYKFNRVVVWFSAGVTSAVAAKLAIDKYSGMMPVVLVTTDTGSEHEDNYRFMVDVEQWLGVGVLRLKSDKYQNTFDVYEKTGWLVGPAGARCTLELKKKVRQQFENLSTDLQVFGFDADEEVRAARFVENNPEVMAWFPLIDAGITKTDARQMLATAGIQEPITYSMGFHNANCLATGCVKGGMGYWNHYRKVFPEQFECMAKMERKIGAAICKTYIDGERVPIYLDELDPEAGNYNAEPAFQCGLFCGAF